jgi:hypothetical protein
LAAEIWEEKRKLQVNGDDERESEYYGKMIEEEKYQISGR